MKSAICLLAAATVLLTGGAASASVSVDGGAVTTPDLVAAVDLEATAGQFIPAGYPNALTTGVPLGTVLTPRSGNITVKVAGTVIDGVDLDGCITVRAHDVTIRNSRIRCAGVPGIWPVRVYPDFRGTLVEDVEIDGRGVATVATLGTDYTLRRVNIHDVIDGPRLGSNTIVEDSFVHDLTHLPLTHNDTLQTIGGSNIVVRGNTLLAYNARTDDPNNGAIQTGRLHTPLSDMLVEGNYMNGGSYTIRGGAGPRDGHLITNYVFRNNAIGHDCGFGPINGIESPVTWETSNHWVDKPDTPMVNDPRANKLGCTKRHRTLLGDAITEE